MSAAARLCKARLTKTWPEVAGDELPDVFFDFNPERVTVSHTYKTDGVTGTSVDDQIKSLGYVEIALDRVVFSGEGVQANCETLVKWSSPVSAEAGAPTGTTLAPVQLELMWGQGLYYQVSLRSVTIAYTRFAGLTGKPIRAEARLGMYQNRSPLPYTNPTSGGPDGRRARLLDASDRLPAVAAAAYGKPGAWRRIARANGVDDPLRLRPGTMLYLPEAGAAGAPLEGGAG